MRKERIKRLLIPALALLAAAGPLAAGRIRPAFLKRGEAGVTVSVTGGAIEAAWRGEGECDAAAVSLSSGNGMRLEFSEVKYRGGSVHPGEGCRGGVRLPLPSADDDGDGRRNEDCLDGIDNDSDGLIDEDFAAVGDRMIVAEGRGDDGRRCMLINGYTWTYEHVADFAGFSTALIRDKSECGDTMLVALECAFPGAGCGTGDGLFASEIEIGEGADTVKVPVISDGNTVVGVAMIAHGDGVSAEAVLTTYNGNDAVNGESIMGGRNWISCDRAEIEIKFSAPEGGSGPDIEDASWAVVFGKSDRDLERNVRAALRTYRGVGGRGDTITRWVVPARKVRVLELESRHVVSWNGGRGTRSIAVEIPASRAARSLKWVRVNGSRTTDYTISGYDILINIPDRLRTARIEIEGQFSDGSLFGSVTEPEWEEEDSEREENSRMLPESFINLYPNPFVDNVNITLDITREESLIGGGGESYIAGSSSVRIYDVKGELVRTVSETDFLPPGSYYFQWDGTDRKGMKVAPGVYYCTLKIGERSRTKRVILLK